MSGRDGGSAAQPTQTDCSGLPGEVFPLTDWPRPTVTAGALVKAGQAQAHEDNCLSLVPRSSARTVLDRSYHFQRWVAVAVTPSASRCLVISGQGKSLPGETA
jgi:hypothetical protein